MTVTSELSRLSPVDKSDVVRALLSRHRKSLDESPFNNQLKLVVSKREAVAPLYLSLVCEEVRLLGVFEEVGKFYDVQSNFRITNTLNNGLFSNKHVFQNLV